MTRRTWVHLDPVGTSCAVWSRRRVDPPRLFRAFDMHCFRGLRPVRGMPVEPSRERVIGDKVARAVAGDICYAFYSKPNRTVKLGRTTNLRDRWRHLETASGIPVQLMSVWHCADSRACEREMFAKYAEYRTLGEWFAADPVIQDLRSAVAAARSIRTA